jgi:6-phosphofructokinase 1
LRSTPGAALGTTRYTPAAADMDRILNQLECHDVRWLILIGGNGSVRGAHAISEAARHAGRDLCVVAAPKTIDNDIAGTDRCPGYGSAARYVAQSVRELAADVRSLPQPVSIFETMGRTAGWLAAASVLGKRDEADAPHLVYLPERAFDVDSFIADVDRVVTRRGWAIVVVGEGLRKADGGVVHENGDASQRDDCNRALPGDVSAMLAQVVTRALKIRCRSEKPGLCGRASVLHIAAQDQNDAELVGSAAVRAALKGHDDCLVSLRPLAPFQQGNEHQLLPLQSAIGADRTLPDAWLETSDISVGPAFVQYARPIVGELIDSIASLPTLLPPARPEVSLAMPPRSARISRKKVKLA